MDGFVEFRLCLHGGDDIDELVDLVTMNILGVVRKKDIVGV